MKLPILDSLRKQEKKDYFLALLLRDESINAVIFEESSGKIRVIGEQEENFEDSIESASKEELLDVADKAISKAEEALLPTVETHKTIYGVKEDWIEEAKIKKGYLAKLKTLSDTLELSPIGFIVIHEAIAHLLQEEEGAPVSTILVEVGKKDINISLLRAGKISESKNSPLEDSIVKTTDRLLHQFTSHDILPSRIIVFNSIDSDQLSQEFIAHTWSKSLPFLHVPRITVLPKGFDARAVLFGAATQMGFDVLKQDLPLPIEQKRQLRSEGKSVPSEIRNTKETKEQSQAESGSFADFGFVKDKDVALDKEIAILDEKLEADDKDQADTKADALKNLQQAREIPGENNSQPKSNPIDTIFSLLGLIFVAIKKSSSVLTILINLFSGRKKLLLLPAIVGIIILFIIFYISSAKATVTLTLTPKDVTQTKEVTFSNNSNFAENKIAAEVLSIIEEGEVSIPATGKKEVGEKAKGEITIYNSDLSGSKSFTKGTIITSSNGLKFTLDETVAVASASGDASSIKSSTQKVNVTAEDIGKEFNLPSETKFTVGTTDTSEVIAKNDKAFAGGSKKEVTVVAQKDLSSLEETLPKRLESKAKDNILKKVPSDRTLLPVFLDTTLTKKSFTKKVGDESSTVALNGTVQYESITYSKEDLQKYSEEMLKEQAKNSTVSKNGVSFEIKDVKAKDKKEVLAKVQAKTSLLPKIDEKKITQEISGKSVEDAEEIVLKTPQVEDVKVRLFLQLPLISILPRNPSNIEIIIEEE